MDDFSRAVHLHAATYLSADFRVIVDEGKDGKHTLFLEYPDLADCITVFSKTESPATLLGAGLASLAPGPPVAFELGGWLTCPSGIILPETVRCEPFEGAIARLNKVGTDAWALVRQPKVLQGAIEVVLFSQFTSVFWLPPSVTYWPQVAWYIRFAGTD